MNRLGRWLWWMDRDDPRFRESHGAKLAYSVVWALGFLFLLLIGQLAAHLIVRLGIMQGTGP
jgi:hypothetical protein